ncbi:MAG TPA: glycosyltransferase [Frankiaceae bacterium]|nr:glycosyltransferase [Frankiaceae bacterium]
MKRGVLVYDVDGLNPYGRELAALLQANGVRARAVTTVDAEWRPPGSVAALPANRHRPGKARQLGALLRGLLVTLRAVRRGEVVVVVLTRGVLDELALAAFATVGRVVVVVHDPVPKQPRPVARRLSYGALVRGAGVRVAHSAGLAALVGRPTVVCRHLPYRAWCADNDAVGPGADGALLVLGHLRPDKGLDRLPAALAGADGARVLVCGKGSLDPALRAALAEVAAVDDRSATAFATDAEVAAALREAKVLVAPYRAVSQSGSVAMALSAGLAVVAYDTGALGTLPGVVAVPDGDAAAFAAAVTAALRDERPRVDVEQWARDSAAEWLRALDRATT